MRNGLDLHLPFLDFNETHLVYTPSVYIGPDAWLELLEVENKVDSISVDGVKVSGERLVCS